MKPTIAPSNHYEDVIAILRGCGFHPNLNNVGDDRQIIQIELTRDRELTITDTGGDPLPREQRDHLGWGITLLGHRTNSVARYEETDDRSPIAILELLLKMSITGADAAPRKS